MAKQKQDGFKIAGATEYKGKPLKCEYLYAEPKLDGMRMIIIMRKGKGKAYTRNGCEIANAKYIIRELENRPALFSDCVIDSEAVILDENGKVDFNLTQSVCMTETKHPDAKRLICRAFDHIRLAEWDVKIGKQWLEDRKKVLSSKLHRFKSDRVELVRYQKIEATNKAIYAHLRKMVKRKVEGGVYKKPDKPYSFRKNTDWLKLKPYEECDAQVTGMKPGKKGKTGQMLGLIGSLDCKTKIAGKPITFNTSGMSMKVRKQLTQLHKKKNLIGLIVEVRHEGVTVKNKVRFPRVRRVRFEKDEI